jgi:hypothetical protein
MKKNKLQKLHYTKNANFIGRVKTGDGYIYIYCPKHPYSTKKGQVREHRLVIEAHLNRVSLGKWIEYGKTGKYLKKTLFLSPKQKIHHKDCNRINNNFRNLKIFKSNSQHRLYHALLYNFVYEQGLLKKYDKYFKRRLKYKEADNDT